MGFLFWRKDMCEQEKRIKLLEENLAWMQRDLVNLINIVENLKPEIHTHYTMITENVTCSECKDDQSSSNDINDFI